MCWLKRCKWMKQRKCKYYHFCPKEEECRYANCRHIHMSPGEGFEVGGMEPENRYTEELKSEISDSMNKKYKSYKR